MEKEAPKMKAYYTCNPCKNVACNKANCYVNGGPCHCTTNLDYALQPVKIAKLVIPVALEDLEDTGLITEENT